MSTSRVFYTFVDFCSAVVRESGVAPEVVRLPEPAFKALETEIGARAVFFSTTPDGPPGIYYETGHGRVRIERSFPDATRTSPDTPKESNG